MTSPAVSRFAPSPTGLLHLGNARTALFSWLYARHAGGRFIVRIEDTDAERSRPEHVAALLEDLRWLGIDFDAGPGRDDGLGPYSQSGRGAFYADAFARLEAAGVAYPCYCSPAELEVARRAQLARGEPPRYAGTCRALSTAARAERAASGRAPTLRFAVPAGVEVSYSDLVRGEQRFASDTLGDFVIRRADGSAAFLASNALDDSAMGVTHVLRGEDHVANTPRQMLLLAALDERVPAYGHLPLLVGSDGVPLAKRHGATSVAELRAQGYLPGALTNLLFRLGHAPAEEGWHEPAALVAGFRPDHLGRAPARLDETQLLHWQKEAVRHATAAALIDWVPACVPAAAREAFVGAVRANLVLPADAARLAETIFGEPGEPGDAVRATIVAAGAATYAAAMKSLEEGADWARLTAAVREATGRKGRDLYRPLRAALTHALEGPELGPVLALMPPATSKARLTRALALCSEANAA